MLRLRELRKSHKLSLKKLGEIMGVAESTMSLYENEKRELDYNMLIKLANYFNVTVDYLLGVENTEKIFNTSPQIIGYEKLNEKGQQLVNDYVQLILLKPEYRIDTQDKSERIG